MKKADLLKRIEQLEDRIRSLEARPIAPSYVPYAVPAAPYIPLPPPWGIGPTWTAPNTSDRFQFPNLPTITC